MKNRPSFESLEEPNINITPLIDVVFVVLIMFILIAPLLDKETIDLAASSGKTEKIATNDIETPCKILIRKDNTLSMGNQVIDLKTLEKRIGDIKHKNPKVQLLILPDKGCSFGTFQQVKNAAERAGFDELQIVLEPPS